MSFKREPKMKTTEPSVDEVKMKKGGKADGGAMGALPTAARLAAARPRGAALMASRVPVRPAAGIPAAKKGGHMESAAEEKREKREIKGLKTELKSHEGKKASVAHKGLKMGGLLGGVEDYSAHTKGKTGDIEGPGYRKGGKMCKAEGGHVQTTKVVQAKQVKSLSTKTGGVEGAGYKSGGQVQTTKLVSDANPHRIAGKTGDIKQKPAGYAKGGHVSSVKGHDGCGYASMKRGGW